MIYGISVAIDILSLQPTAALNLIGANGLVPGVARKVPGGVLVFQAAVLNTVPGEASVYRFTLQFGSVHAAAQVGTWLYMQLRSVAASLSVEGTLIPIDHRTIISALEQAA